MTWSNELTEIGSWGQNALNAYSEDKEGGPWGALYDGAQTVLLDLLAV